MSSRLKQDDKALAELETLISGIKFNGNDADIVKRASQLSTMLADYNAQEIHYRLDRLYLEAIQSEPLKSSHTTPESETIAALEEELESLYPEIEILAEMSTKQQYHDPILREIHNQHSHLRAASEEKLERVCSHLHQQTLRISIVKNLPGPRCAHRHDSLERIPHQAAQPTRVLM